MDTQTSEQIVNKFATASRWRMRMRHFIIWGLLGALVIGFFLLYAWWQQHGVNRIVAVLPENTVLYLSTSQPVFRKENIFDNKALQPLLQQLTIEGYDFSEINQDTRYAGFVLTKTEERINRYLFIQCATFNCVTKLLHQYPTKASQADVLIVVISFDEALSLDNKKDWTQKLPKQLYHSDLGLFVEAEFFKSLASDLNLNLDFSQSSPDIFVQINQQENNLSFELLSFGGFESLNFPAFDYPVASSSAISFGPITFSDLALRAGENYNSNKIAFAWKQLFKKDLSAELSVLYEQPLAIQIIYNEKSNVNDFVLTLPKTEDNLKAVNEFIPMWLAQQFPTYQDLLLVDGTKATHLVSEIKDWQWQATEAENLFVINRSDHLINLAYAETANFLFVGSSTSAVQAILAGDSQSAKTYSDSCKVDNYGIVSFSNNKTTGSWLAYLPNFVLVADGQQDGRVGCIFLSEN
jgi:hypothetical protein